MIFDVGIPFVDAATFLEFFPVASAKLGPRYAIVAHGRHQSFAWSEISHPIWFNRQTPGCGRKAWMDPCYRSLLEQVPDRYARDMLSPFFRFLSAQGVQPDNVRDGHVDAYVAYRKETSF